MFSDDDLELFFDTDHNHGEILDRHDNQFVFSPAGKCYQLLRDTVDRKLVVDPPLPYAVRAFGTINTEGDRDTGYVLECAIPWGLLELQPRPGLIFGFDLINNDRDFSRGQGFLAAWSGTNAGNIVNASEWGNNILQKKEMNLKWLLWAGILGLLLFLLILRIMIQRTQKPGIVPAVVLPGEPLPAPLRDQIRKAKEFIEAHFNHENLDREMVAKEIGLSLDYFSSLFKKETGTNFVDYLNQYRIQKAGEMLKNTRMDISQVAYAVGFANLFSFNRTFKKFKGIAPTGFRKNSKIQG
jgi:AraC-like DNA-binding protein